MPYHNGSIGLEDDVKDLNAREMSAEGFQEFQFRTGCKVFLARKQFRREKSAGQKKGLKLQNFLRMAGQKVMGLHHR